MTMPFIYCGKCFKFHHDSGRDGLYEVHMKFAMKHKSGNPVIYKDRRW